MSLSTFQSSATQRIHELERRARQIRRDILTMIHAAKSGHPGGSLSACELAVALYFDVLRHDPRNPSWEGRDYVLFSKGHVAPLQYACLARAGYFDVSHLQTLRKLGSILQGHPSMQKTPGVEVSSGSLGQGLSIATGLSLGLKMRKAANRVYCILGDGELQEGQAWEAAMSAAHFKLDNLCAIVDFNGVQLDGRVEDIMGVDPLADKWRAFGWHVVEIDGHDLGQILAAYAEAEKTKGRPTAIIARTIKGKGVSFMEDRAEWHGKAPNDDELRAALAELEEGVGR
ncbi:MAG: transketolase [Syntrophothermus sp.]